MLRTGLDYIYCWYFVVCCLLHTCDTLRIIYKYILARVACTDHKTEALLLKLAKYCVRIASVIPYSGISAETRCFRYPIDQILLYK